MSSIISYLSTPPRSSSKGNSGDAGDVSGSATPPPKDSDPIASAASNRSGADERVKILEEQMQNLLVVCAENEVDVPEDIRRSLEGAAGGEDEDGVGVVCSSTKSKDSAAAASGGGPSSIIVEMSSKRSSPGEESCMAEFQTVMERLRSKLSHFDLRVKDGSYVVTNYVEWDSSSGKGGGDGADADKHNDEEGNRGPPRLAKQEVRTVASSSISGGLVAAISRYWKHGTFQRKKEEKVVVSGVNLYFETGKMYLVLGGPGSGKSTVLKMIADELLKGKGNKQEGTVTVAGMSPQKDRIHWNKFVGYVDQIDRLHPYLTVKETCEFAWQCRYGGTHALSTMRDDEETRQFVAKLDDELFLVNRVLERLGLARVENTFVGDQSTVRGVSGYVQ